MGMEESGGTAVWGPVWQPGCRRLFEEQLFAFDARLHSNPQKKSHNMKILAVVVCEKKYHTAN